LPWRFVKIYKTIVIFTRMDLEWTVLLVQRPWDGMSPRAYWSLAKQNSSLCILLYPCTWN